MNNNKKVMQMPAPKQDHFEGHYNPENVTGEKKNGKIIPICRDSEYTTTECGMEVKRQMMVGGQPIIVRSFFSADAAKTPTQQLLRIIDRDLEKMAV